MRTMVWSSLGVLLLGGAVGCGAPGENDVMLQDDPISQGISTTNGLRAINGLTATNGLVATNGLRTTNGLATTNGLRTTNGLATTNGLMTTSEGRLTASYIAKCALANNDYMDKQDNYGNWHRYYGRMGVGTGWKDGSCDAACQQKVSACVMAHMNSTGQNVPIFINADPDKMPSVGMSLPHEGGSDAHIMEGVFFGNVFASNPPQAYYVKGDGFRANIPGRLGASSSNPYKAWSGYRPDNSKFYDGVADGLCMGKVLSDGEHFDYKDCGKSDWAYGPWTSHWQNVMTTYVNRNYNGTVSQNWSQSTISFEGDSLGQKTGSRADVWVTANNFEFKNTVSNFSSGKLNVVDLQGSKWLCINNNTEHLVITKNSGEPFSLMNLKFLTRWGHSGTSAPVRITGYSKGSSSTKIHDLVITGTTVNQRTLNWDNLLKVEVRGGNNTVCVDDLVVKT